jgi:HSP20 family protein
MTLVRRTSPFGELVTLRHTMDRLFDDSFSRPRAWGLASGALSGLPLDVRSGPDALVVEAALPGIRPEDVEVTVEDRTLAIRAEAREEHHEGEGETLVREIRRGSASRTITLPRGLETDRATATFENGILRLSIPRAEDVKPHQIQITPTIDAHATNGTPVDAGADTKA